MRKMEINGKRVMPKFRKETAGFAAQWYPSRMIKLAVTILETGWISGGNSILERKMRRMRKKRMLIVH